MSNMNYNSAPMNAEMHPDVPIMPAYSEPARYILVPAKSSILPIVMIIMLAIMLMFSLTCNLAVFTDLVSDSNDSIHEKFYSGDKTGSDKIAIIIITGTIDEGEDYKDYIDKAMKDDDVKGVILRVDSPGGTVTGSDYILNRLNQLRKKKPIVVSMGSMACSGGYYVSMCVGNEKDSIFIEPTGWTGSIGVIISRYDASELFNKKLGVFEDPITSGRNKAMGSPLRPLNEEQRKIFQDLVDDSFIRFKDIVKAGRPRFAENPKELDDLATGQVYSANQALELGLVDKIGFLDDAIEQICKKVHISPDDAQVVKYGKEASFSDLFSLKQGEKPGVVEDVKKVINKAASPKAYYLWQM
ncbi:MAG: signal peptide peptidase SppA [Thermoguttaceae bacterium]|nr:signal peptide peptidase SppA [Thermoguttaceae bacterium]